jgi:hypothetical protein
MYAAPFSLFPKAGHLASLDGRFEVRDVDLREPGSEFSGIFHSLWLVETATGRSRKLCEYVGVAAVALSEKDSLMVMQYPSKKTSRALIFATTSTQEPVVLDVPTLIRMVPVGLRPALRENDHAFVEASRLEGEIFYFQVWGYGQHDSKRLSLELRIWPWRGEFELRSEKVSRADWSLNLPWVGMLRLRSA